MFFKRPTTSSETQVELETASNGTQTEPPEVDRPDTARMLELAATESDVMLYLDPRDAETIDAAAKAVTSNAVLQYVTIEFDPPRWGWKGTFYNGPLHKALQRSTSILRLPIVGSRTPESWKFFAQRNVMLRAPLRRLAPDAVQDLDESCDLANVTWAQAAGEHFAALGAADRVDGGAEGAVYRVTIDGVQVAGKQPCYLRDPEFYGLLDPITGPAARAHVRRELLREAHALKSLSGHPNVVGFHGVFYTMLEGVAMPTWICMTYIGKTLHHRIEAGEADFQQDMLGIASGLEHIHSHRMMHRDLKPKNILVADDGTMIVADFGFTKVSHVRTSQNPAMHTAGGTPAYRAPEANDRVYDASVDVYAMGIIGVEILLKESPAETHDLRLEQVARAIDEYPEHAWLVERCTATTPPDRPASSAVKAVLEWWKSTHDHLERGLKVAYGILNHGVGPYPPCEEAVRLLRSAADHGNPDAMCELGVCLFYGRGVHVNQVEAKAVWREAASKGSVEAAGHLARRDPDYRAAADPAVIEAAISRWRARAAKSHADAQHFLGLSYDSGIGVTKDHAEGARWYQLAADQVCAAAQRNLGYCYYYGEGAGQDYDKAVELYRLAAESGYARAQTNLGRCYEKGKGVPEDDAEAVRLYRLSAQQGEPYGQLYLGKRYKSGTGVEKNLAEAKRLLTLGAEQDSQHDLKISAHVQYLLDQF